MRLILLSLGPLLTVFFQYDQVDYDHVKIYISIEHSSPSFNEYDRNENYLRVNATTKILLKNRTHIKNAATQLLDFSENRTGCLDQNFDCKMLIDFISHGKIRKTVAISTMKCVRYSDRPDTTYYLEDSVLEFYEKYMDFVTPSVE